jgi:hypothetical protein
LGQSYNPTLLKALLEKTALEVPNVVSAQATINRPVSGKLTGVIKVIDITGAAQGVKF